MLLLLFLLIAPLYRVSLFTYRYLRTKKLKSMYEQWLLNQAILDRKGKRITILWLCEELTSLLRYAGNGDIVFSESSDASVVKKNAILLEKAKGFYKLEVKKSFFPHTYFRYLCDLPLLISRKVGIAPQKAALLFAYLIYLCIGLIDINLFVDKTLDFFA